MTTTMTTAMTTTMTTAMPTAMTTDMTNTMTNTTYDNSNDDAALSLCFYEVWYRVLCGGQRHFGDINSPCHKRGNYMYSKETPFLWCVWRIVEYGVNSYDLTSNDT